jgi:hypothetical protein
VRSRSASDAQSTGTVSQAGSQAERLYTDQERAPDIVQSGSAFDSRRTGTVSQALTESATLLNPEPSDTLGSEGGHSTGSDGRGISGYYQYEDIEWTFSIPAPGRRFHNV